MGDDLVLASFLRPHLSGLHPYLHEADLPRGIDVRASLPEGARLVRQVTRQQSTHVVAAVGEGRALPPQLELLRRLLGQRRQRGSDESGA